MPYTGLPSTEILHWGDRPSEYLALKATGAYVQELHGTGEIETPFLKGTHKISCALIPREKQRLQRNLGQT